MGRGLLLVSTRLLRTLIRWPFIGLVFILPWLLRIIRGAFFLALAGVGGLVRGIPESTQTLADTWSSQILEWGVPPLTVERLNPMLRVWGFGSLERMCLCGSAVEKSVLNPHPNGRKNHANYT
jgi:hypothetical protein